MKIFKWFKKDNICTAFRIMEDVILEVFDGDVEIYHYSNCGNNLHLKILSKIELNLDNRIRINELLHLLTKELPFELYLDCEFLTEKKFREIQYAKSPEGKKERMEALKKEIKESIGRLK